MYEGVIRFVSLGLIGRIWWRLTTQQEMRKCIISVRWVHFVLSGVIMALLLIPLDFKARTDLNMINASDDSLAARMSVDQLLNFMAEVPSPHINVTEEELNRLWQLPSSAEISPGMRAIGRCRIASEGKYHGSDKNVCNRIQVLWPKVVVVVAFFNFIFYLGSGIVQNASGWAKNDPGVWRTKMEVAKCSALISAVVWIVGVAVSFQRSHRSLQDMGLSYTLDGEVHPRAYYNMPIAWVLVLFLCEINAMLKLIEACCIGVEIRQQHSSGRMNKNEKRRLDRYSKSRWDQAEKRFFENNSGVPPKMLRHVVKFCKAEYSATSGYLILENANPFSPVFIDAVKEYGKKKRSKK